MQLKMIERVQRSIPQLYQLPTSRFANRHNGLLVSKLKILTSCGLLSVTILLSGPALASDFYKWTDNQGVIHFTDKPPMGVKAEKITGKQRRDFATEEQQVSSSASSQAAEEQAAARAKRCTAEQSRLKILESNSQIRMKTADGTMKDLAPKEIAEEIAFAQKAIAYYCD